MDKKPVKKGALALYIIISLVVLAAVGMCFFISSYFPLKYADYIKKYSDAHGLEPEFVCAIIATESRFNPDAESKVGALGLMQIMPETAEWIAPKIGIDNIDRESLKDPETNIRLGTWYLEYLMDRYENRDTAAAAYNAGHGNVDKWLENEEYSSDGVTLKAIPFEETRNYVKKVNFAYEIYKTFYSFN